MTTTRLLPILALGAIAACSSSRSPTTSPDAGGTGGNGNAPSYTVTVGPLAIPAGSENTQCVVRRLGNPLPLHVGSIHDVLGSASHHMVVYRVNDATEQTTPFDCKPFQDTATGNGAPIIISQKSDDTLTMPDGVAYTLDANQMLRIEMHYINATSSAVMLTSSTTMNAVADYTYEASFLLIGDTDIKIPSSSDVTLGPVFLPLDAQFGDANFFALTGHEHQLGTDVQVAVAGSAADPGTMVYDVPNWIWSEPATVKHDPAFTIPSGGGFRFSCQWHNPNPDASAPPVVFGESANNEMCFFWAYYYPSHGSHVCLHTEANGTVANRCLN